jgi:hypothetical protein
MDQNIHFSIENEEHTKEFDADQFMNEFEEDLENNNDNFLEEKWATCDYNELLNMKVKELLRIAEFYSLKVSGTIKKAELIYILVEFEQEIENMSLVLKRKRFWYFVNELRSDPFMKKYVLWNM